MCGQQADTPCNDSASSTSPDRRVSAGTQYSEHHTIALLTMPNKVDFILGGVASLAGQGKGPWAVHSGWCHDPSRTRQGPSGQRGRPTREVAAR